MPFVVAHQVQRLWVYVCFLEGMRQNRFLLNIDEAVESYKHVCVQGVTAHSYVSRVFNQEGKVVSEPRLFSSLNLIKAQPYTAHELYDGYPQANGFYLDLTTLANELSIPDGYYIEVLVISFQSGSSDRVLFPYETRVYASKVINEEVNKHLGMMQKIGMISQSHSFLGELGLSEVANEVSRGYECFERGDYDGAIKAYRKAIEGLRNHLRMKVEKDGKAVYKTLIDSSETRTEKITEFLNKTYDLLSNFGEHYGTHAFDEEGLFAHKLIEDLTEYLTKKLSKTRESSMS